MQNNLTIFITVSRGAIARNILQNEFYDLVKRHFDKVILITTAAGDARFAKEFGAPNVEIVPMLMRKDSFLDTFVSRLYKLLIFNESTVGRVLYWYEVAPSRVQWLGKFIKYLFLRAVFQPLSKVTLVRRMIQRVDYLFLQQPLVAQYRQLIKEYRPDAIFATSILEEAALLKAARRERIPTVAMPKTWDNPSKLYFRARADAVAVWSSFVKDQMINFQDYREDEVVVVGVPQYDYFLNDAEYESREEFCAQVGLDPKKKIICLGSEGKVMPSDADIAAIIYEFIKKNELIKDCQLFIRPHFGYKNDAQKFSRLIGKPGVVIDMSNTPSGGFRDQWDYSKEHMRHFLNLLRHVDVIMSTASTLTLDAVALGRPNILIMFDGYEKKPFYASGTRWYVCDYFAELMRYQPALVADSPESLCASINKLLNNSTLLLENQERLCERFCYRLDGNAGKRLFQKLHEYSQNH